MKALDRIKMAKRIRAEIPKKQKDYGNNVDKYNKGFCEVSAKFNWYQGSFGSSSVYDILHNNFERELVNRTLVNFLNRNVDVILELLAKEYEAEALKEKQSMLDTKKIIEEFLMEIE